jgi:PAS domain S-box-containing protein
MFKLIRQEVLEEMARLKRCLAELEGERCSIAAPMYTVDTNLMITFVNTAALTAMGYRREEVVGKMTCADFSRTPLCGTERCTLKQCFRTAEPVFGDTTARTKDGHIFPIRAACSPSLTGMARSPAAWRR